jgi:hypothetical protein
MPGSLTLSKPTADGGLIAAGASAALGFTTPSCVLFGLGITSFVDLPG